LCICFTKAYKKEEAEKRRLVNCEEAQKDESVAHPCPCPYSHSYHGHACPSCLVVQPPAATLEL